LWEQIGKPDGQEQRFWHEAEAAQIKHELKTPDNL
jgi:hypothetical protein